MHLDYFVVGPELALRSIPPDGPRAGPRLDFVVDHSASGPIGFARSELLGQLMVAGFHWWGSATGPWRAEAVRMLARVLRKLAPVDVFFDSGAGPPPTSDPLMADGFCSLSQRHWHLPRWSEWPPAPKVSLERLSDDPFRVVWNFEPRPSQLLATFFQEMGRFPGARVLDVGCGFGKNAVLLEQMGFETHGVDSAGGAIELCRRWVAHPLRFRVASANDLPFEQSSFDAVLDVGCLHCVSHGVLLRAVNELARVLRRGGYLFSRMLLPRPGGWLRAQRYRIERLGLEAAKLVAMLEPFFDVRIHHDAEASYVTARRR